MKLSFAIFAAALSSVAARYQSVPIAKDGLAADSELGMQLLSKARRVEEADEEEVQMTWVSGYSIKFQGCHSVQQWNDEADEDEDVRIQTKRLVRFRLCPTETCSSRNAAGCSGGHGDYIIDLNSFMDAYFEATRQATEYQCEAYLANNCDCDDDDGKGDDFDAEICEYDCFAAADMADSCADNNPYEDDESNDEEFEAENYMECQEYEPPQDDDNRRLEEAQEEEEQWFVGPYCAEQGGAVFLGMFTDESCSTFADTYGGRTTFQSLAGTELPYSEVSLIGPECISCLDREQDENDDNNGQDELVSDACEEIYTAAGKCEYALPEGMVEYPNNSACNYIGGVKVIRQDGIITAMGSIVNPTATVFIVLFALACAGLGFYVYYLRTRLGMKQDTLL